MNPRRESGAALLVLLTVLVALAASAGVTLLREHARRQPLQQQQLRSLAVAADALRGEAFRRRCQTPTLPDISLLPCPDSGGVEGAESASCPGLTRGWLPWRTLELPPLRDSSGTCLWYERVGPVARVIAPGAATAGQNRNSLAARPVCGGNNNATNYLDLTDTALVVTLDLTTLLASCP